MRRAYCLAVPMAGDALLSNWLGALAVAAGDCQVGAMKCGRRDADVATVLTLRKFSGTTVGGLAGVLGLSHSATVRVADRLCADGLVLRRPASAGDGREVPLTLTAAGAIEADRLQRRRLRALQALLDPLNTAERAQLAALLDRMLRARPRRRQDAHHTCRFCDHAACSGALCPIGNSVNARSEYQDRTAETLDPTDKTSQQ